MTIKNFITITKEITKGKSLIRTMMNLELRNFTLSGKVLDIGGGKNPSYLRFFKKAEHMRLISADLSSEKSIDLEMEKLPYENETIDQILLFNILEHIYNHKFLISEACRVLKKDGAIIGFVPFFVGYHPDPHDYFRYTRECLENLSKESGFDSIDIIQIGHGPFVSALNLFIGMTPGFIIAIFLPMIFLFDWILGKIRPKIKDRFELGYLFVIKKQHII